LTIGSFPLSPMHVRQHPRQIADALLSPRVNRLGWPSYDGGVKPSDTLPLAEPPPSLAG
jgi:hypothetical protein